jgi:hypothetical protein
VHTRVYVARVKAYVGHEGGGRARGCWQDEEDDEEVEVEEEEEEEEEEE